jgi:hypothetical protein
MTDCRFGTNDPGTSLPFRRGIVDGSLRIDGTVVDGSVEFSACRTTGWFEFDDVTVGGGAHFPNATFDQVRWATNRFLDGVSGYEERPRRTVLAALAVVTASGVGYPAVGGLRAGQSLVSYGSEELGTPGTSLYFSVTTFTTLGLGDVHPATASPVFGRSNPQRR